MEKEGAIDQIRASGDLLRTGLDDLAAAYGFALRQTGPSQMPLVLVDDDPTWEKTNALCSEAVQRGVYMHPWHNMFICAAHREADIREALDRLIADPEMSHAAAHFTMTTNHDSNHH